MKLIDLVGLRFGRLIVVSRSLKNNKHGQPFWECRCDCGNKKDVLGYNLRHGHSSSCGCGQKEAARNNVRSAHYGEKNGRAIAARKKSNGKYVPSSSEWYRQCAGRHHAAKVRGIPFGFSTVQEFAHYCLALVPKYCPVLGIEIKRGCKLKKHNPSVDRIVPENGYVPGNIQIISNQANMMKNSASAEELVAFAKWILNENNYR